MTRCKRMTGPLSRRIAGAIALAACLFAPGADAAPSNSHILDIVMLGDSQLSFGSGPAMQAFLENLEARCAGTGIGAAARDKLADLRVGVMGVRSTAPHMWMSKTPQATRMSCVKDPTGLVHASAYGALRTREKWVQIGESGAHQFCRPGTSPLQQMLAPQAYRPRLLILHFLGLAAYRWTNADKAAADAAELTRQLPPDMQCLYVTTAPNYRADLNRPRLVSQHNIEAALKAEGRCGFVPGLTDETLSALQGNARYYYRHADGRVKDPYHPNPAGAEAFIALRREALCKAIASAFDMPSQEPMAELSAPPADRE